MAVGGRSREDASTTERPEFFRLLLVVALVCCARLSAPWGCRPPVTLAGHPLHSTQHPHSEGRAASPARHGCGPECKMCAVANSGRDACGRAWLHADQTWDDSDVQMSMPEREGSHAFWRVHITHVHSHAHRGRESLAHTRAHAAAGRGQKQTSWSSWRSSSSPTHGSTSRP